MGLGGCRFAVVVAVAGLMIGCGNDPSAPVASETRVGSKTDAMLHAYNDDDYDAVIRDWSDELKHEIDRSTFESSRAQILAKKGRYLGIINVTVAPEQPDVMSRGTWSERGSRRTMTCPSWSLSMSTLRRSQRRSSRQSPPEDSWSGRKGVNPRPP
jgi:hypothetical protein